MRGLEQYSIIDGIIYNYGYNVYVGYSYSSIINLVYGSNEGLMCFKTLYSMELKEYECQVPYKHHMGIVYDNGNMVLVKGRYIL